MTYCVFSLQYNNNTNLAQLNESQLVNCQRKCNYCDSPKLEVELWDYFSNRLIFWSFLGVDTDELDSNVDDWEEETIEFFINEEIIPIGDL